MDMQAKFQRRFNDYIRRELGIQATDNLLLAVSGGLDSVAMATLIRGAGLNFGIAHCNFQLRGAESDQDQQFVEALAGKFQVPCHSQRFDVKAIKAAQGKSTQMVARELRYAWFRELASRHGYQYIAKAHHLHDHFETILANMINGTGMAGLHGIRPISGQLIRPMLVFTRAEIHDFVQSAGIEWREDSSNSADDYQRNFIRHHITPLFQKLNPGIVDTMWRNSENWHQAELLFKEQVAVLKTQIWHDMGSHVRIDMGKLKSHPAAALVVFELIKDLGFNFTTCQDMVRERSPASGKTFTSQSHTLLIDRDSLILAPMKENVPLNACLMQFVRSTIGHFTVGSAEISINKIEVEKWQLSKDNMLFQADVDKIQWPMEFRHWQQGDSFVPLGMKGKKKVSDLMIDAKIPVNLKSTQLILRDQAGPVWAVGLRIADRVKITAQTTHVITINAMQIS